MKNSTLCLLALSFLLACKKDKDEGDNPNEPPPTSVGITVNNATTWSANQPYGAVEAGATVSLYKTIASYPATPAYTATTNAEGQAAFANVEPGEYYVVAEKEYMHEKLSNVLYYVPGGGGFTADSLYQATPTAGPNEPIPLLGAAGNFRYKDLNADGKVDFNDQYEFPALKITAPENKTTPARVMIGALDNRLFKRLNDATSINAALTLAYNQVSVSHEMQTILDAVYTDEYDCTSLSSRWCTLNSYQIQASDQSAAQFWNNSFAFIAGMGNIIANTELATGISDADKKSIIAQAKAMKAYVYLELTNYFGPLPTQDWILLRTTAIRAPQQDVYNYIEGLLTAAQTDLQATNLSTGPEKISAAACQALLARLYLQKGNYQKAAELSASVITGYNFSLGSGTTVFTQATSPEMIWNGTTLPLGNEVKLIFNKGTILPELRLAEMLLINAEASVELGQTTTARDRINQVRLRANLGDITSTDAVILRDAVQEEWKREMAREGVRFPALVRWNKTMPVLAPLGFDQHNRYLPIPQSVLNWNYNLMQNVGYQ